MLDGIDYYPAKAKKKSNTKSWILGFLVISVAVYWYQNTEFSSVKTTNDPTLIIVSKAKKTVEAPTSIIIKSSDIEQPMVDRRVKSNKGLDELIQTFKRQ
ncbi:MAG: hypothetical protein PSN35_04055 [Candidatus Thioglobus sp.]|uniref:hypothetical protein n=1 Tax=Candidatus Thioglobus sp. TaxID=2026721 RepID=UPI002633E336|nr:hypothetical protein [Candidatus Thioglobus sp.]MDC9726992.1 hypothetical protein [Candidatus Thioglobus sp.]